MGKSWDGGGISFDPETWVALATHLHPGAFGMAFGGARTWHRLAVAIEDAGLIIHPSIFGWAYGSGFPKATRIDTQIDKMANRVGENVVELKKHLISFADNSGKTRKQIDVECGFRATNYLTLPAKGKRPDPWVNILPTEEKWQTMKTVLGCDNRLDVLFEQAEREIVGSDTKARKTDSGIPLPTTGETEYQTWDITEPATDLAKAWEGHRYGLQAIKPSLEPVIVFQKPYEGKPVECITETGAGALNIEQSRIGTGNDRTSGGNSGDSQSSILEDGFHRERRERPQDGRWPANFFLQHHPECEMVGVKDVKGHSKRHALHSKQEKYDGWGSVSYRKGEEVGYANADGKETVPDWRCHPECPVRRLGEQSGESVSSGGRSGHTAAYQGGYKREFYGDMKPGLGDKGTAARFFYQADWMYERLEQADPVCYQAKASRRERDGACDDFYWRKSEQVPSGVVRITQAEWERLDSTERAQGNIHATVKPIALSKWLATLLLPPQEYAPRRLLVPFAGVASEMIGAMLAGWEEIVGIELDGDYCEIGRIRLNWWTEKAAHMMWPDAKAILKEAKND
jgi:hypothetical protein